jgi:hypothetical protein
VNLIRSTNCYQKRDLHHSSVIPPLVSYFEQTHAKCQRRWSVNRAISVFIRWRRSAHTKRMVTKAQKTTSWKGKRPDIGWKCLFSVFLLGIAYAVVEKPAFSRRRHKASLSVTRASAIVASYPSGGCVSYPSKKQYRNTEACAVNTVDNIDVLVFRSFRLARWWPKAVFIFINLLIMGFHLGRRKAARNFFPAWFKP